LGSARGDLRGVIEKFRNLLRRYYREITTRIQFESTKFLQRFGPNLWSLVRGKVSVWALDRVHEQYMRLSTHEGENKPQLPPCTSQFRKAYGLPCAHDIKRRREANTPLTPEDFHFHWFFNKDHRGVPISPQGLELV
jgi:hypothetical protein